MNRVTIDGKTYTSETNIDVTVRNGQVVYNGDVVGNVSNNNKVEIRVLEGTIHKLEADGAVNCNDVTGNVSAGGSVNCDNIGGNANAGGSINCDDIGGNANAGGSIRRG